METLALIGVLVFFGILLKMASFANKYWTDDRINQMAELRQPNRNNLPLDKSKKEKLKWNILLDDKD